MGLRDFLCCWFMKEAVLGSHNRYFKVVTALSRWRFRSISMPRIQLQHGAGSAARRGSRSPITTGLFPHGVPNLASFIVEGTLCEVP